MKQLLTSALAAFAFAASGYGLTIVPTFDSSITSDPNGPAMKAAINAAIHVLEADIADNMTVFIDFTNDTTIDLGASETWGNSYGYSDYLTALKSRVVGANDVSAISTLPDSPIDPLLGGNMIYLTLPLARVLGLDSGEGPDGFDATVHLNMTEMNFSRPSTNPDNYDLQAVAYHEMDEVLGTPSGLPFPSPISPPDLFRYTTNLVRTYTTSGDDAYFSIDGVHLRARYNQDGNGDYGDWWSGANDWAPPGLTPVPQVQDAYADPGSFVDLGSNELAVLDVIGWTLAVSASASAPKLAVAKTGAGQITLEWDANYSGYSLQESTTLAAGSWVASASGTANPASIALAPKQKFYRLVLQPVKRSDAVLTTPVVQPKRTRPLQLVTHVFLRRIP